MLHSYRIAELIATWLIRYNDPDKGKRMYQKALERLALNKKDNNVFKDIITGKLTKYDKLELSELLEINKIITTRGSK